MSTEFDQDVQRACEPFGRDHDRLRAELMASLPAMASEGDRFSRCGRRWWRIGGSLMKHRFVTIGIPVAAAVAVVLFVGLWPQGTAIEGTGHTGRVYGAADIPALLNNAEVLHVYEWFCVPGLNSGSSDLKRRKIGADYWIDKVNGRWHLWYTDLGLSDGADPPADMKDMTYRFLQRVSDGEYVMELWYDLPVFGDDSTIPKKGNFTRLTPFMTDLEVTFYLPWCTPFTDEFRDASIVAQYQEVGEETLDGDTFTIWQREYSRHHWDETTQEPVIDHVSTGRTKVWLSPTTGNVGRLEYWSKGPSTDNQWALNSVTDIVERNVTPPPGVFETVAPPEYEMANTKATAPLRSIAEESHHFWADGVHVRLHMDTMLNDGSILVGWSSWEDRPQTIRLPLLDRIVEKGGFEESPTQLFEELTPGGPLPALPLEIRSFTHRTPDSSCVYTGRHLAWTQKDGRCYEWGIYVPSEKRPPSEAGLGGRYIMDYVLNTDRTTYESMGPLYGYLVSAAWRYPSTDATQFDRWARGAMAELSDDGVAPEYVTYEFVTDLCEQIRSSLNEP